MFVLLWSTYFIQHNTSSSIQVEVNGGYLSFLMAEEYSIVYINHIFFIHSSFVGHRGSFHSLAIVDMTAINIRVQVSQRFIVSESLGYIIRSKIVYLHMA